MAPRALKAKEKHVIPKNNENLALNLSKQEEFSKKVEEISSEQLEPCGTMYIGHIPHGFYEEQIRDYFTQFGTVNKVRLARSKKTGGYKGYGYIQFDSEVVAKIAADAMNNYLMFDKLLKWKLKVKCFPGQYVPEEKLHPSIWKGANKKFVWLNRKENERKKHNMKRSKEQLRQTANRLIQKDEKRKQKLLALGIKYDFPGFEGAMKPMKRKGVSKKISKTSTEIVKRKAKKTKT